MEIVTCTDKWCVMPTGVMMTSVCVNNPDVEIVFHLIHDDSVSERDRNDLTETVTRFDGKSIVFHEVDLTRFPCLPTITVGMAITQASYYRLLMPEILPTIPKVLYLDSDIIVRHSLLPLWNTDLTDMAVGVVPDGLEGRADFYERLQYPRQLGYFNAGVILVNLDYWRQHDAVSRFMGFLQHHAQNLLFADQDILNVTFKDCKTFLPLTYNLTTGYLWEEPQYDYAKYVEEVLKVRKDPAVVHFAGNHPWIAYNRQPVHPFASSFFKYQNMTKWKGTKIDKRPWKKRVVNFFGDLLRQIGLKAEMTVAYKYIDIAPVDNC